VCAGHTGTNVAKRNEQNEKGARRESTKTISSPESFRTQTTSNQEVPADLAIEQQRLEQWVGEMDVSYNSLSQSPTSDRPTLSQ